MDKYIFDFEKLEVYNFSIKFINEVFRVSLNFKAVYQSSLGDQLRRASLSIATNIAEGNGKYSHRDKTKYFGYSLDSAKECIPILTVARDQKQIDIEIYNKLRDNCSSICRMLLNLIKSISVEKDILSTV